MFWLCLVSRFVARKNTIPKLVCMCVHMYIAYMSSLHSRRYSFCTVGCLCFCCCLFWCFAFSHSFRLCTLHTDQHSSSTTTTILVVILNRTEGFSLILWAHFDGLVFLSFSFIPQFFRYSLSRPFFIPLFLSPSFVGGKGTNNNLSPARHADVNTNSFGYR